MKKVFCDHCGKEMEHGVAFKNLQGGEMDFHIKNASENGNLIRGFVKVNFNFVTDDPKEHRHNAEHYDICVSCRWAILCSHDPRPRAMEETFLEDKRRMDFLEQNPVTISHGGSTHTYSPGPNPDIRSITLAPSGIRRAIDRLNKGKK